MLLGVSIFQQVFVFGFWNPLTPFCSSKKCQIVRESHRFEESDLLGQVDDLQGENVFVLLNVDGSLPFPSSAFLCPDGGVSKEESEERLRWKFENT